MEIKVQEYKFDNCVSLSQRYQYYLGEDGKHVRHGIFESWHPNGKKDNESNWEHGRFHGKLTVWRNDGSLSQMGDYKEGREDGLWQFWHVNSKLMARVLMENGRPKEGDYYSPDGKQISSVKNGAGRSVFFNDEGKIRIEEIWKEGKVERRACWYSNGQLRTKEEFSAGELLVTGEYFSPSGKKLSEVLDGNGVSSEAVEIESSDGIKFSYLQAPCLNGALQPSKWSD
jgi:antitoxin component YwqK of YwqJK toxin-antitoxin module